MILDLGASGNTRIYIGSCEHIRCPRRVATGMRIAARVRVGLRARIRTPADGGKRSTCHGAALGRMNISVDQLGQVFAASQDATFVVAADGRILAANAASARVFGYASSELVGRRIEMLVPERWRERHVAHRSRYGARPIGRLMGSGIRLFGLHKQGHEFPIDVSLSPITLGGAWLTVCAVRDVSERIKLEILADRVQEFESSARRLETELKSTLTQFEQFIKHTPAAVAVFDRDMRYVASSDRWRSDYGLGAVDLRGRSHYEVFPELPERWKEAHRRGLAGEKIRADEDSFVRADGRVEWLRWQILPWRDATGAVGGIAILTEVLTDERAALQRLSDRELYFSTLFNDSAMPVALQEAPSGAYIDVNREWSSLFGYSAEEVRGKTSLELGINSRSVWSEGIQQVLEHGMLQSEEVALRSKSGAKLEVVVSVRLVQIGGRERFVLTYADRTERKRLERELGSAVAREQSRIGKELHDGLGQVLTGAALLTSAVLNRAKKEQLPIAPDLVRVREIIEESIRATRAIAQGLSPLIDANDSMLRALRWQAELLREGKPLLTVSGSEETERELPVDCRAQLYRIAQEAIQNAMRHAAANRVEVDFVSLDGAFQLTVADDGGGMPAGAAQVGRGLSLMRYRAEAIGGRLSISPRPGGGTIVRCTVPRSH